MITSYLPAVIVVLMAGLSAACGQDATTAETRAQNTARPEALREKGAEPDKAETVRTAAMPASRETPGAAGARVSAQEKPATVKSLPLRPGHYVRSGTRCDRASSADMVTLVSPTGMNLKCKFKTIEKTGATTYRVTSECSDGGAAWGRQEGVETSTDLYEIPNDTSFQVTYDGGSKISARYCSQTRAVGS